MVVPFVPPEVLLDMYRFQFGCRVRFCVPNGFGYICRCMCACCFAVDIITNVGLGARKDANTGVGASANIAIFQISKNNLLPCLKQQKKAKQNQEQRPG